MLRYRSPIISQYQAECTERLQQVAQEETGKPIGSVAMPGYITWYIMISGPTRLATEESLKTNAYFGSKAENDKTRTVLSDLKSQGPLRVRPLGRQLSCLCCRPRFCWPRQQPESNHFYTRGR